MKSPIFRAAIILFCIAVAAHSSFAGPFRTKIISPSDDPLTISIVDNVILQIRNFTQVGGVTRGVVTTTVNDETVNVLSASQINSTNVVVAPEFINRIVIAGPATVTVAPVAGATLAITYRKLKDEGSAASSPTPTPSATVSPTPTPTATP